MGLMFRGSIADTPAMGLRLVPVAICLVVLSSGCASPGAIRGTLSTRPLADTAIPSQEPGAERGSVADAVVYLEELDHRDESRLRAPYASTRLELRGQSLRPRILVVPVGSSVVFPNEDSVFHNVFSVSPAKRFDLGRYARGKSKRLTFDKPGLVNVYCKLHPDMAAYIVVVPNRAFTRPDSSGRFALPTVPRGRYALNVWHPDFPAIRREVTITDGERSELVVTLGS